MVYSSYLLLESGGRVSRESGQGDILLEQTESFNVTQLYWVDAFGNPFPAGVEIQLVNANNAPAGSAFSLAGGYANLDVNVGDTYTATFIGVQGPNLPFTFTVTEQDQVLQVPFYASPTLSEDNYATTDPRSQSRLWPRGWFGDAPPIALRVAGAVAAVLAAIDALGQYVLGKERVQSSQGLDIASWANDFIGPGIWSPGPTETDPAYLARVLLWLQSHFTTLYALQTLVQAYVNLFPDPPTVYAFDWQSDPVTSSEAGLTQYDGQFCLSFTFPGQPGLPSWFLGGGFLGDTTYLASQSFYPYTPPSAVQQIVQLVKACGTQPIYVSNVAP
jgi:hypothetical protein